MNIFAITSFITAIASLMLGVFIYLKNKTRVLNKAWFVMSAGVAVWSCFYGIMISTSNAKVALVSARMLNYGAMFIPSSFLHFLFSLIGQERQRRKLIFSFHCVMGLLLATTLVFPNYLVSGVSPKFGYSYYTAAGPIFLPYFIIWGSLIGYAFILLLLETNKNTGNKRNQLLYTLFASLIGFPCGATTFLSVYMSNIYPWGTSLISFYVLIISYAIVKHHLMDIRLALTKAGIFLSVYVLTLGFPFWVAYKSNSKFLPVSLAVALALIGPAIHRRLQAKAEAVLFAQQKKYQNFLLRAGRGMLREHDLDHLLRSIVRVIRYGVKVQFAAALLFNAEHKRYELKALRDHQHMPDKFSVPQEHKLIGLLQQRRIPLSHEDIVGILEQYSGSPIHLVVPAFSDEILLGFLVLGEKEDHTLYTEDDIRVFSILAGQATMAIENCIFIKEAQDYQKRIAQGEKLASLGGMAYNLSHQMGNHLHAFEQYLVEFDLNMEEVMEKYPNPTPEREKTVVEFISETNKKLRERFKHCATLTSGICDHARKMGNPVFKAFPFEKCVEFSLWSLDLKHSLAAEARPFEMIVEISGEGTIYGIEGLLDEAVYNIIDNCYEAIKEKRDLCLSLEDKALYKPFIKAVFAETEDNYLITISDNGVGVKLENRTKMFDPFFTTKSSEVSGRGIGMYAVHKIIVEHLKGKIRFESEHMKGITFFIELPKKAQDTTTDA